MEPGVRVSRKTWCCHENVCRVAPPVCFFTSRLEVDIPTFELWFGDPLHLGTKLEFPASPICGRLQTVSFMMLGPPNALLPGPMSFNFIPTDSFDQASLPPLGAGSARLITAKGEIK